VPSLLTEVIGRSIAAQFFRREYTRQPTLAVKPQRPIPPPERVAKVPKKFLHLVGNHLSHDEAKQEERRAALNELAPAD
jgi:hypothetical protein